MGVHKSSHNLNGHASKSTFIFNNLGVCFHVFLCVDTVHPSQPKLYSGPHKLLLRIVETFVTLKDTKAVIVVLDRLELAHPLLGSPYLSGSRLDSP
ncbi:hypothetical protein AVEN_169058-1 [Araneus ventricosus]|uniref:Uncharacterized protein n=1 Tax=Araneus ventricosus TaxID=182803 RepID=A0A4Y2TME3_ARAVE|nr:hypothetical protein AVEN_169058-1 [Araneus ventricosus]